MKLLDVHRWWFVRGKKKTQKRQSFVSGCPEL